MKPFPVAALFLVFCTTSALAAEDGPGATSVQTSPVGEVVIRQQGVANQADVQQIDASVSRVAVEQLGNRNAIQATQVGGYADSQLIQRGDDNRIDLWQTTTVYYGTAVIAQDGERNTAELRQGPMSDTRLQQVGADNRIIVDQQRYDDFFVTIEQVGQSNMHHVTQLGGYDTLNSQVVGERNQVELVQDGWNQSARLDQSGNDNRIVATQRSDFFGGTILDVAQTGSDNTVDIEQGSNAHARLSQTGNANEMRVRQTLNNDLNFSQTGTSNVLAVDQGGSENRVTGASSGNGNSVDVRQASNHNELQLSQNGDGNLVTIGQLGWSEIDVAQTGNDNEAHIRHASRFNELALEQVGEANLASVAQGGGVTDVRLLQHGTANQADITSYLSDSQVSVSQTGSGNSATVSQRWVVR